MNCPRCDADISDSYERDDPSVGICGGWYCGECDLAIGEHEVDREPMEGDIFPAAGVSRPIGTPLSQLSGRPGHDGYAEFVRIARSWGHD